MGTDADARIRRPRLKAGLRQLRRGPTCVQFGVDPEHAVVLTDLGPDLQARLGELDGTRRWDDLAEGPFGRVLRELAAADLLEDAATGIDPAWGRLPIGSRDRLTADLAALTLSTPGPDGGKHALGRRLRATVEVRGAGRVGAPAAALLAAAGIGTVDVVDPAPTTPADLAPAGLIGADLGQPRAAAAARHLPPPVGARPRGQAPDVVLLADILPAPSVTDELVRAGVPHLPATIREPGAVVGPLVLPGRSGCLRCLDLHRSDRDPQWPLLAAQLISTTAREQDPAGPCDVVVAACAAVHAVLQILHLLSGHSPATDLAGITLHLDARGGSRRRRWARHPRCGCSWAAPVCPSA